MWVGGRVGGWMGMSVGIVALAYIDFIPNARYVLKCVSMGMSVCVWECCLRVGLWTYLLY